MKTLHPQEKLLSTYTYNGIAVDLLEWADTIWCGKIGYADDNTGEPDVDKIMSGFQALDFPSVAADRREPDWDVCMSVNYLSSERPNGVMFGFLVSRRQEGFDIIEVPAAKYMRICMCADTAKALNRDPWRGGIPPYEWIGEIIAPDFGYTYGDDSLPIFEYYGNYNPEKNAHEYCYLYVPVKNIENI